MNSDPFSLLDRNYINPCSTELNYFKFVKNIELDCNMTFDQYNKMDYYVKYNKLVLLFEKIVIKFKKNEKYLHDIYSKYNYNILDIPDKTKRIIRYKDKKNKFYKKYLDYLFHFIIKYFSNLDKNVKIDKSEYNKSLCFGFYNYEICCS